MRIDSLLCDDRVSNPSDDHEEGGLNQAGHAGINQPAGGLDLQHAFCGGSIWSNAGRRDTLFRQLETDHSKNRSRQTDHSKNEKLT